MPTDYSTILHYPFNTHGQLDADALSTLVWLIGRCERPRLQLVPARCRLIGLLAYSAELSARSTLSPSANISNVHCGVDIHALNRFSVRYYEEIELKTLKYEPLTDRCELSSFEFSEVSGAIFIM